MPSETGKVVGNDPIAYGHVAINTSYSQDRVDRLRREAFLRARRYIIEELMRAR